MPELDSQAPHADFTTTHWSVVLAAGQDDSKQSQEALEQLCRAYWYPLYSYVRRQGRSPADAEDLTQEFFARLLADLDAVIASLDQLRPGPRQVDPRGFEWSPNGIRRCRSHGNAGPYRRVIDGVNAVVAGEYLLFFRLRKDCPASCSGHCPE